MAYDLVIDFSSCNQYLGSYWNKSLSNQLATHQEGRRHREGTANVSGRANVTGKIQGPPPSLQGAKGPQEMGPGVEHCGD